MTKPAYVILDFETTGLDCNVDAILEVGAIAIDANLNVIDSFHRMIEPAHLIMNDFVRDMHTKNDLLLDLDDFSLKPLSSVDVGICDWLRCFGHVGADVVLAGNSIAFDVGFIHAQMPSLARMLHYRSLDVSSMARFFSDCGVSLPDLGPVAHRAMLDCSKELEMLQVLRDFIKKN